MAVTAVTSVTRSALSLRLSHVSRSRCGHGRARTTSFPTVVDKEFLEGGDYKVPLTQSQKSHYHLIFQINDHSNNGHLEVAELGRFIDSLGHGFSISELHEMLHEVRTSHVATYPNALSQTPK